MDKPKTDLAISDLAFSLYQRSVHPELFNIYAERKLKTSRYEASATPAGREDAMFHLGVAYRDGRGVRQSPSLAIKWLSRSNRDGRPSRGG